MTIIKQELDHGATYTDEILLGRKTWKGLFTKHTFFTTDFKYYISITCASKTKEAHKIWSGFVESKIRVLVQSLERHPSIAIARPFNKGYDRVHCCKTDADVEQIQNGSLDFLARATKATDPKVKTEEQVTQVKPEPKSEPEPPGPVKKEENGGEEEEKIKLGDIPLKSEDAEMEIYTTNHYIGLELAEGKSTSSP